MWNLLVIHGFFSLNVLEIYRISKTFKRQGKFQRLLYSKMKYTKYEQSRIIGSRALQIAQGAPFMIKLSEKDLEKIRYNPIEIAKMEFKQDLVPITVKREEKEEAKK